jgi:hypothetical protein
MSSALDRTNLFSSLQADFIDLADVTARSSALQNNHLLLQNRFPFHEPKADLNDIENAFRRKLLSRESWTVLE